MIKGNSVFHTQLGSYGYELTVVDTAYTGLVAAQIKLDVNMER